MCLKPAARVTDSVDLDRMQHSLVVYDLCLHCLLLVQQFTDTSTGNPLCSNIVGKYMIPLGQYTHPWPLTW